MTVTRETDSCVVLRLSLDEAENLSRYLWNATSGVRIVGFEMDVAAAIDRELGGAA